MIQLPALVTMPWLSSVLRDPGYESRCIESDAKRAAKIGDPLDRACSHDCGSWQHQLWLNAYHSERVRLAKEQR